MLSDAEKKALSTKLCKSSTESSQVLALLLSHNLFIYSPSFRTYLALPHEWLNISCNILCCFYVVIVPNNSIKELASIRLANIKISNSEYIPRPLTLIITYDEIPDQFILFDQPVSLIWLSYSTNPFNLAIQLFKQIKTCMVVTVNPIIFDRYLTDYKDMPYTSINPIPIYPYITVANIIQSIFQSSTLIYHPSFTDGMYYTIINEKLINKTWNKELMEIIKEGIYHPAIDGIDKGCVSEKVQALLHVIRECKGKEIQVFVKRKLEAEIIKNIVEYEGLEANVGIELPARKKLKEGSLLILVDFITETTKCKRYILAEYGDREYFKRLVIAERVIEDKRNEGVLVSDSRNICIKRDCLNSAGNVIYCNKRIKSNSEGIKETQFYANHEEERKTKMLPKQSKPVSIHAFTILTNDYEKVLKEKATSHKIVQLDRYSTHLKIKVKTESHPIETACQLNNQLGIPIILDNKHTSADHKHTLDDHKLISADHKFIYNFSIDSKKSDKHQQIELVSLDIVNIKSVYSYTQSGTHFSTGMLFVNGESVLVFTECMEYVLYFSFVFSSLADGLILDARNPTLVQVFVPLRIRPKVHIMSKHGMAGQMLLHNLLTNTPGINSSELQDKLEYILDGQWTRATLNELEAYRVYGDLKLVLAIEKYAVLNSFLIVPLIVASRMEPFITAGRMEMVDDGPDTACSSFDEQFDRLVSHSQAQRCILDCISGTETNEYKLDQYCLNQPIGMTRMKSVILSPLRISFTYHVNEESNQVLRAFDPDKFMRIYFREEDGSKIGSEENCRYFDELVHSVLKDGLQVGARRYFFVGCSSSQVKNHCAWLIAPYSIDGSLVGPDSIRNWIGALDSIKSVGKCLARIGMAFTSTSGAGSGYSVAEVQDISRNGYCFSDGIGMISTTAARTACSRIGLSSVPSALQVRYGGYKGVLAVHRDELLSAVKKSAGLDPGIELIFRQSMCKFESKNNTLEIVAYSKPMGLFLNKQAIILLEGLGIDADVFIRFYDQAVAEYLIKIDQRMISMRTGGLIHNCSFDFLFNRRFIPLLINDGLADIYDKCRIRVRAGRSAIGVLDELGILGPDEVFLMFTLQDEELHGKMVKYGQYAVPVGPAILFKNPCVHPGDIRVVRAVDCSLLHYLRDVLVLPKSGSRPLFNMCSGSDLDGDVYSLSWHPLLIPRAVFKPYDYDPPAVPLKQTVLLDDLLSFFITQMRTSALGLLAYAHIAAADRNGVFSRNALQLAGLFNRTVDCTKTGVSAELPDHLMPESYPDFMQALGIHACCNFNRTSLVQFYPSEKVLGILYRRRLIVPEMGCECAGCLTRVLNKLGRESMNVRLLYGSGLVWRGTKRECKNDRTTCHPLLRTYSDRIQHIYDTLRQSHSFESHSIENALFLNSDPSVRQHILQLCFHFRHLLDSESLNKFTAGCHTNMCGLLLLSPCSSSLTLPSGILPNSFAGLFPFSSLSPFLFNSSVSVQSCSDSSLSFFDPSTAILHLNSSLSLRYSELSSQIANYSGSQSQLTAILDVIHELFALVFITNLYNESITELFDMAAYMIDGSLASNTNNINSININTSTINTRIASLATKLLHFYPNQHDPKYSLLFKILMLLLLDCSLVYKATALIKFLSYSVQPDISKPYLMKCLIRQRVKLIINGMLHSREGIELNKRVDNQVDCVNQVGLNQQVASWQVLLNNKGIVDDKYYTGMIKEGICALIQAAIKHSHSNQTYSLKIFIGQFSVSANNSLIDKLAITNRLTINELEELIEKKRVNGIFKDTHAFLDPRRRKEYLKGLESKMIKEEKEIKKEDGQIKNEEILGIIYYIREDKKSIKIDVIKKGGREADKEKEKITRFKNKEGFTAEYIEVYEESEGEIRRKESRLRCYWECSWEGQIKDAVLNEILERASIINQNENMSE